MTRPIASPPVPPKTEMLTFRGTETLKEMLDKLSRREGVTRSDFIRTTLENAVR